MKKNRETAPIPYLRIGVSLYVTDTNVGNIFLGSLKINTAIASHNIKHRATP